MQFMARREKLQGAVVPMMTPVTADGALDGPAAERVVDFLIAGGVSGIFVLGTTGEGASVSRADRQRLVEFTVLRARGRALVYAGIGDTHPDGINDGNAYLKAGADVIVSRPRAAHPLDQLLPWYQGLLDGLEGPLIIYNMPMTTKVSIPLDIIEKLLGHPKLVGIKDSENNPARLEELFRRFGGRPDFAIFIGVGALMAEGLKRGAAGIVPSVGNLIPEVCQNLCTSARRGDWAAAESHFSRMNVVAALYQKGRTLNESLTVLKGAMSCRGLCLPHVLPPLRVISEAELASLRSQMSQLQLLNGKP
jgi:dihydrodipicolinate synthase/N-acetylneuraminate lyase